MLTLKKSSLHFCEVCKLTKKSWGASNWLIFHPDASARKRRFFWQQRWSSILFPEDWKYLPNFYNINRAASTWLVINDWRKSVIPTPKNFKILKIHQPSNESEVNEVLIAKSAKNMSEELQLPKNIHFYPKLKLITLGCGLLLVNQKLFPRLKGWKKFVSDIRGICWQTKYRISCNANYRWSMRKK